MNNAKDESKHFWGFPLTHFSYFFIWAVINGYLTLWLEQVAHLNGTESGAIFSMMAGISLIFQPIFGILSDRLLFKKTLILTISIVGIFIGPYFQWVFMPVLHINSFLVAFVTGVFLSFVLNGGVSVIEQYVQRASLANKFEYAHSRVGGSVAGVAASLISGPIFLWHPNSIFWACTIAAVILTGLLLFSDKINMDNATAAGDTSNSLDMKTAMSVFKIKNLWVLAIFYMGASALYDVFDQQFIIYGFLTCIRILGSAFAPNWIWLVGFRLVAGLEMPLLLTSIMKYIAGAFDIRLYATVYALASNFAKQVSVFIFSSVAGTMYDSIGFQHTYLIMGIVVLIITLFAAFFLKKEDPIQAGQIDQTTESLEATANTPD